MHKTGYKCKFTNPTTYTNQTVINRHGLGQSHLHFWMLSELLKLLLTVSTTGLTSQHFKEITNVCDDFLDINGDDNALTMMIQTVVSSFDFSDR